MIYERIEKMEKELAELKVLAKKEEEFKVGDYLYSLTDAGRFRGVGTIIKAIKVLGSVVDYVSLTGEIECAPKSSLRKATSEEIEKFLIKEAEKKGFVKGARVNRGKIDAIYFYPTIPKGKLSDSIRKFEKENGVNFLVLEIGCSTIPLEECDLPSSCPQITIGGKTVEFFDNHIKVGCKTIYSDSLKRLYGAISQWNSNTTGVPIHGIEFTSDGITISSNDLRQISEHYENK